MKTDRYIIRMVTPADRGWMHRVIQDKWKGDCVVVHEQIFYPQQMPGCVAEDLEGKRMGLVTYQIRDRELEIITLNSFEEGRGIGSALMAAVENLAREGKCTRIRVTTTNDNQRAIDFYRRLGYALTEIRKGAVDRARMIKPSIPEFSLDGNRISDEVEFERSLSDGI